MPKLRVFEMLIVLLRVLVFKSPSLDKEALI